MTSEYISYKNTKYYSSFICDYIEQKEQTKTFYDLFPSLKNFKTQILKKSFSKHHREVLVSVLQEQYQNVTTSQQTEQNIKLLKQENSFTITTGHQLNLFTGPLYFLYKIISTINLTKTLKKEYPDFNFIPIYWMATEDHDFDEICYFNFKNEKIQWNKDSTGAVGRLNNEGLQSIFKIIETRFGNSKNGTRLKSYFKKAYLDNQNLAQATRVLANELFKEEGLVIIDADHKALKTLFIPKMKEELLLNKAQASVNKTNEHLKKCQYPQTAHPRSVNLFYLKNNSRNRINKIESTYDIIDSHLKFSEEEIIEELNKFPERFSPNVILRPLYQEVILPNLCYIGGGGEIAYWMQLKQMFENFKVPFPILLLRNSVLLLSKKQNEKMQKLGISIADFFNTTPKLINKKIKELSEIKIDFSKQKEYLNHQFKELRDLSKKTDASFIGAVNAQERKQIKGLQHLEKRLLKAQKRKHNDFTERITILKSEVFPNEGLQERSKNFSEFYLEYGDLLIDILLKNLKPLHHQFLVLTI